MRKEKQRVRNYEWAGSTSLCLAVQSALLRALSRGCCSPKDKTGESCSICLHRPPDDPNYTASHGRKNSGLPVGSDWSKLRIETELPLDHLLFPYPPPADWCPLTWTMCLLYQFSPLQWNTTQSKM